MRKINCDQRVNNLLDTVKTEGVSGNETIRKVFIFNIPIFYNTPGRFFSCKKEFYQGVKENITPESRIDEDKYTFCQTYQSISHFKSLLKSLR